MPIMDLNIQISIRLILVHFINLVVSEIDSVCMKTYKTILNLSLYDIYSQWYGILKNRMVAILDFTICGRQGQNWAS